MPIDASIPLSYKPVDGMANLSSLLDTRKKMLELNKSTETYDSEVARIKADSSTAQSGATVNAANVNPLIDQQAALTSSAQTGAKSAQFKLSNEYMGTALQTASGMHNDPRISNLDQKTYDPDAARQAVMEAEQQMIDKGVPAHIARQATNPFFNAAGTAGHIQQMIKNTIVGNQAAGTQSSTLNDSGVGVSDNDKSQVTAVNQFGATRPGNALPGTERTLQLPVGERQSLGKDQNNNPIVLNKDKSGNINAPTALPGSATAPVMTLPSGANENTTKLLNEEYSASRAARNKAPEMHANNKGILEALNEVIATGPAGKGLAQLSGLTGLAFDSAEKAASAYDKIGKYAEKNALAAAAAMGNETNGKIEAQIKANGSARYNPTALKEITMLNDALVTGSEKYSAGLDKAVEKTGHVYGKLQFDREWAANANVDTLKYLNAVKLKDTAEIAVLIKKAGPEGSPGRLKLVQELHNLQKLTQTGSL